MALTQNQYLILGAGAVGAFLLTRKKGAPLLPSRVTAPTAGRLAPATGGVYTVGGGGVPYSARPTGTAIATRQASAPPSVLSRITGATTAKGAIAQTGGTALGAFL